MGATGTGKTTFINLASGSNLITGQGLHSCTSSVQVAPQFKLNGHNVLLIDTPGFDDTEISDTEILRNIASFMVSTYQTGKNLSGIIYFHRISDFRMGGISTRNFRMFRALCGESSLKSVIIVTNMWGEVSPDVGEAREAELSSQDIFLKPALDKGARLMRHNNTRDSAWQILERFLGNRPVVLRIQREIEDEKKDVSATAAGIQINAELKEQEEKHRQEVLEAQSKVQETIRAQQEKARQEREAENARREAELERARIQAEEAAKRLKEEAERVRREMQEAARRVQEQAAREAAERERQAAEVAAQIRRAQQEAEMQKLMMIREMNQLQAQRHRNNNICIIA
ncbi:hypothetical protein AX17_006394 [Amanita inopinata Kibby_2008]|nr:hypothetical protein AX17_006394 [Amanita inopinata Kibby_2008]